MRLLHGVVHFPHDYLLEKVDLCDVVPSHVAEYRLCGVGHLGTQICLCRKEHPMQRVTSPTPKHTTSKQLHELHQQGGARKSTRTEIKVNLKISGAHTFQHIHKHKLNLLVHILVHTTYLVHSLQGIPDISLLIVLFFEC